MSRLKAMGEQRIVEWNLGISLSLIAIGLGVGALLLAATDDFIALWLGLSIDGIVVALLARTTIEVGPQRVSMRFTPAWPRRVIDCENVEHFRIVDIPWWVGWGFRWGPGSGWCWRAAGSHGVEFELRSGSTFVIGCKDPERVVAAMGKHPGWAARRTF